MSVTQMEEARHHVMSAGLTHVVKVIPSTRGAATTRRGGLREFRLKIDIVIIHGFPRARQYEHRGSFKASKKLGIFRPTLPGSGHGAAMWMAVSSPIRLKRTSARREPGVLPFLFGPFPVCLRRDCSRDARFGPGQRVRLSHPR